MRHLDLFSGIGGFALAISWVWPDHKIVAFCEIDAFCQKVLKKHWPDVPIIDDIQEIKGEDYGTVDLVTGGFPCQPFSQAGKRGGTGDDRYLWPEMLRVIKETRPRWIIGENVAGIESLFQYEGFSHLEGKEYHTKEAAEADFEGICEREGTNTLWMVLDDLEKIGYEVQPFVIPACAVNAPHRRDRVWIIANATSNRRKRGRESTAIKKRLQSRSEHSGQLEGGPEGSHRHAPYTGNPRLQGGERFGTHEQGQAAHGSVAQRAQAWDEPWLEAAARLCTVDDGVSGGLVRPRGWRVNALKAAGNAIVPQVAAVIMEAIKELYNQSINQTG